MRQDVFTGFHSDCIDRPGNDVPVYLLDLIRRSDQVADAESRYIMRFRNRLYQDQVRMVADIRRFQQPFRRESDVCLVDDKDRLPVRLDQCQQFGPADQSAVRIIRVTDPAETLSFQREAGQVARGRKETDFMPVQAASVFILHKRGNGNSGFRPFPGLRQQIECRDGTVRNHYILLFHLIAAGKQSFQGRSIRFRITREFIKLLVQVFPECAEIGSMPYI